jgi:oligo-alginate lyase
LTLRRLLRTNQAAHEVANWHSMIMTDSCFPSITRRNVVKLLAMAAVVRGEAFAADLVTAPLARTAYPRLFYNAATIEQLKKEFRRDPAIEVALRTHGDALLAAVFVPESVAEVGGGQQANYNVPANQIADMGIALGLLFHLTGDQRYSEKLRQALLYYTGYVRWAGPGLKDRIPPWHSVLETSRFCFGYAAGYDALHGVLSEIDRRTIVDGMVRLGGMPILEDWILPGKRIHSLDTMGHNWWGVCVAGAGICALSLLGEYPRAQQWLDAIDAGFVEWFNYRGNVLQNRMPTFERSGPSYESVGYTSYGVNEYLRFRLAWQNVFPGRRSSHMQPLDGIATYFLHMLYPTSTGHLCIDFNDSALTDDVSETVLLLIACGLGSPDGARYLEGVHTHPQYPLRTLLELHRPPSAAGTVPQSHIYPDMGWTVMRSSWENDSTLLAMKSGYTWNHAHADAGTFVLFDKGVPLIIDSGTCSYGRPEYTSYYRQSRAHNVVLFDGQGQPEDDISVGCKFPGHMHSLVDGLGLKYAYADATGPMARWMRRNYRHWLWSGDVILILDDVLAFAPGKIDWLLHFAGECKPQGDAKVLLHNGAAQAEFTMLYPAVTRHEETGLADHKPDEKVPYLVFTTKDSAKDQHLLAAICLNPSAAPTLELMQDKDYLGVRVSSPQHVEETYVNLRSKSGATGTAVTIDGWDTDAYMLQIRRPAGGGKADRLFMSDGSYLRYRNQSLMESLAKRCVCWDPDDPAKVFVGEGHIAM